MSNTSLKGEKRKEIKKKEGRNRGVESKELK